MPDYFNEGTRGYVSDFGKVDGVAPGAGYVGEPYVSIIGSGSAIPLVTGTIIAVTSIPFPAGNWDIFGSVVFGLDALTNYTEIEVNVNNAVASNYRNGERIMIPATTPGAGDISLLTNHVNIFSAVPFTYYLCARMKFSAGSPTARGILSGYRMATA